MADVLKAAETYLESLPSGLAERARLLRPRQPQAGREFVLYWMRTAVRADENPALDVAIAIANQIDLPVLVYHALSERYPYASDRHHTFVLQAARDVQVAIERRDVGYAFHLERPGQRGPHLKTLAKRSAFVVTEDMPVEPLRRWTGVLTREVDTPVISVDTACVMPMRLVAKAYERAYAFRDATKRAREERLRRPPVEVKPKVACSIASALPFEPIDVLDANIAQLVGECEIDHSIGPVTHTKGGSSAGYERWRAFKNEGLKRYASLRNNALIDGVSRMSAYLHYGMVSPMRLAREAAEIGNKGAEKFLDELLVWREVAYAFCFYRRDHARLSALPGWAITTLKEHEADERPALMNWETLARGRTGDRLWDAAQRSLLIQGELHNNVRMTWGKALLNWTPDAKRALAMMVDLNHRYALDGRDPASFGGILWCLGQFDRPFPPARAIYGTVRDRSTSEHAKRLDPQAFMQKVTRPLFDPTPSAAVIGAGIAGLTCARTLADHGCRVTVFEKSRGVGGRMATRRTDGLRFDHGAQYFTVRDPRFRRYVDAWAEAGIVKPWLGRIVVLKDGVVQEEKQSTDRLVAVPGMNGICRQLADDVDIRFQSQVAPMQRLKDQWQLSDQHDCDLGRFDVVVVSAPAVQTAELLRAAPAISKRATEAQLHGCWAAMLALSRPLGLDLDGAFVHESPLSWVARNSSKPGRADQTETWVLHASSEWSQLHIEEEQQQVLAQLVKAFWQATGLPEQEAKHKAAHRWRYALPANPLPENCLFDPGLRAAACGDWCGGPRVEGAFLSGMAAAGRVLGLLNELQPSSMPMQAVQRNLF